MLQQCSDFSFVLLRWQIRSDVRGRWPLYKVMAQHAMRELLGKIKRVDTICFEQSAKWGRGHHLWLVTHLKTRLIAPTQNRGGDAFTLHKSFTNINHKKYMLKAGAEPALQGNIHFSPGSLSLRCHIHGWGFFSLVNFNSERLSRMLSSNIRGSKRRIKMNF